MRRFNRGQLAFGSLISLVGSYGLASLAIDSGSLWQYFCAIVLFVLAIKAARRAIQGNHQAHDKQKHRLSSKA